MGEMAKNCIKITKSTFWGENSVGGGGGGGAWGELANFLVYGGIPTASSLTRGIPNT